MKKSTNRERWMTRTVMIVSATAIAAVALSGCSSSGGSSTGDKKPLTIGLIVGGTSNPFFAAMGAGARDEAKALGVKLIFQGDPTEYSPATQIPYVNQVLAEKPSGLALAPTDPVALQSAVNRAVSEGIPVVNVDSSVNDMSKVVSFITGNNEEGGQRAADAMAKAIGYKPGKTYKVVAALASATTSTNVQRLNGFKKQIAAKYPGIDLVATGYSQQNTQTANTNVSNWLTQYPDLAGIFAIDGPDGTGAAAAVQAKGLTGKVALVGYDAVQANVDLLKKDVFTALIAQNPAQEGKDAVRTLVKYIRSGDKSTGIQKTLTLPNIVLDQSSSSSEIAKYTYHG